MTKDRSGKDDVSALEGIVSVSRETAMRLERFVALLNKWQAAENLIAPSTLSSIWRRHVADSAQLIALFPEERIWLDLGSGAGFPGIVLAILLKDTSGSIVHLVESNQRKCAFLREVIRETKARAEVHRGRIDEVLAKWSEPFGTVTARAVAPLHSLLSLAEPAFAAGARGAFQKGQDFENEIAIASKSWSFDLVVHQSRIEPSGVILEISNLARKANTYSA